MCDLNGKETEIGGGEKITIRCSPKDKKIQWSATAHPRGTHSSHSCHEWNSHPLSRVWACPAAADQINKGVNKIDKHDEWTIRPRDEENRIELFI